MRQSGDSIFGRSAAEWTEVRMMPVMRLLPRPMEWDRRSAALREAQQAEPPGARPAIPGPGRTLPPGCPVCRWVSQAGEAAGRGGSDQELRLRQRPPTLVTPRASMCPVLPYAPYEGERTSTSVPLPPRARAPIPGP